MATPPLELPVIDNVPGDAHARADGAITIRAQLGNWEGNAIAELVTSGIIQKLGKGINKQVYRVNGKPWVVAVVTAGSDGAKWRAVRSEIEQLVALRAAGITVPSLGPVTRPEEALIDVVDENGEPAKAFIEQLIEGNHALCRQESHEYADKFAKEIEEVIGGRKNFNLTKFTNAKNDLAKLADYFARGVDIPDFQIVVERSTGHVYTIDPGDPTVTGDVMGKHLAWMTVWQKLIVALEPRR